MCRQEIIIALRWGMVFPFVSLMGCHLSGLGLGKGIMSSFNMDYPPTPSLSEHFALSDK